jgi:hypothetical protein
MLNPAWVERESPLDRCPLKSCQRDGVCRHATDRDPCRRLHETKDAMRYTLAKKLEAMTKEARRRDPEGRNYAAPGTPEHERRMKALKEALYEADAAHCKRVMAAERAAAKAARKAAAGKPEA